jgi:hypothetical protein
MTTNKYAAVTEANSITGASLADALKNNAVEHIRITCEPDGHFYLYAKLNWKPDEVKLRFNAVKRGFWDFRSLDTAWTFLKKLPETDVLISLQVNYEEEDSHA